jgi:hypothetical protein
MLYSKGWFGHIVIVTNLFKSRKKSLSEGHTHQQTGFFHCSGKPELKHQIIDVIDRLRRWA